MWWSASAVQASPRRGRDSAVRPSSSGALADGYIRLFHYGYFVSLGSSRSHREGFCEVEFHDNFINKMRKESGFAFPSALNINKGPHVTRQARINFTHIRSGADKNYFWLKGPSSLLALISAPRSEDGNSDGNQKPEPDGRLRSNKCSCSTWSSAGSRLHQLRRLYMIPADHGPPRGIPDTHARVPVYCVLGHRAEGSGRFEFCSRWSGGHRGSSCWLLTTALLLSSSGPSPRVWACVSDI